MSFFIHPVSLVLRAGECLACGEVIPSVHALGKPAPAFECPACSSREVRVLHEARSTVNVEITLRSTS